MNSPGSRRTVSGYAAISVALSVVLTAILHLSQRDAGLLERRQARPPFTVTPDNTALVTTRRPATPPSDEEYIAAFVRYATLAGLKPEDPSRIVLRKPRRVSWWGGPPRMLRYISDGRAGVTLTTELKVQAFRNRTLPRTTERDTGPREVPFDDAWRRKVVARARRLANRILDLDGYLPDTDAKVRRWRRFGGRYWQVVWYRNCYGYPHIEERCFVKWDVDADDFARAAFISGSILDPPPKKIIWRSTAMARAVSAMRRFRRTALAQCGLPNQFVTFRATEARLVYARPNYLVDPNVREAVRSRLVYAVRIVPTAWSLDTDVQDGYPFMKWVFVDARNGEVVGGASEVCGE